jgi:phosphate transport system permease protein
MATMAPRVDDIRGAVERSLRGDRADVKGMLFKGGLLVALFISLLVLIILFASTLITAWPVFRDRGLDFVASNTSSVSTRVGVRQGIVGSLILAGFVAAVAIPLGVASAIYLQEYARDTHLNRLLITNTRNLAGVPSVVYGILGVVVFVKALHGLTGPGTHGRSYISGGLTLSMLVMPLIILVTMEALRAVPRSIREAAYGVGATRWEVVRSHVLPYAAPGIFTGTILSLARAFGETAPILLVGAVTGFLASPPGRSPLQILQGQYTALPTQIYAWSKLPAQEWRQIAAAAIIVLLAVILLVNAVAIVLRNRYERTW